MVNCTTRDIPCKYTLNAMPRATGSGSSRVARRRMVTAGNGGTNSNGNGRNGNDHTRPIDRVRRLEELVASLTADRRGRALSTGGSVGSEGAETGCARSSVSAASTTEGELRKPVVSTTASSGELPPLLADRFGRLEVNGGDGQVVYLSAAHWATICDEVR
ncbi:hypothetical protein LTR84_010131 [Exophiala bonariae]|uniref:Uncharacterized protein n=1 Tax=Exophiala bonariae TaxID=1690606 RepID=A0AAV9NKM9_9EURO|nr:hypothetical protein LTR84_010131 [Exophiala bonariae]